jgi:hypothetical protein
VGYALLGSHATAGLREHKWYRAYSQKQIKGTSYEMRVDGRIILFFHSVLSSLFSFLA